MAMTKVEIDVPEEIVPYTVLEDKEAQITRNAMLVYPYIKSVSCLMERRQKCWDFIRLI